MSNLEDFIADIGSDKEEEEEHHHGEHVTGKNETDTSSKNTENKHMVSEQEAQMEEALEQEENEKKKLIFNIDTLKFKKVTECAKLKASQELQDLLKRIDGISSMDVKKKENTNTEENPEFGMVIECNKMILEILNEIGLVYKFIRDHYAKKFSALEQLVLQPLDYARCVKRIGNNVDISQLDLSDILPAATIMIVSVEMSSIHQSQSLTPEEEQNIFEACDLILELEETRMKIFHFVESRMALIAPNVSALVGSGIAAQLLGVVGGLLALSKLPSNQIALIGLDRKNLSGFSTATMYIHTGFLWHCDLIQTTPVGFRSRAQRLVVGKVTIAARVDSFGEATDGSIGRKLREEIETKLAKAMEPPPPKQPKPLPAPDDKPKKRRGGKRVRRIKEKFVMTELRRQQNRVLMSGTQETIGQSEIGLGMLGDPGADFRVRLNPVDKGTLKLSKKQQKQLQRINTTGIKSGLSSSLAFTPLQGIELENPEAAAKRIKEANERYFGSSKGFLKLNQTTTTTTTTTPSS